MRDLLGMGWPGSEPGCRRSETKAYFGPKAEVYDRTDDQPYWVFSDMLLWRLLCQLALDQMAASNNAPRLLDAGCGTARWTIRILDHLQRAKAVLVDVTPEMLGVASRKLLERDMAMRTSLIEADLNDMSKIKLGLYNLVICFHNVLSFVDDPEVTIRMLCQYVQPGGYIAVVVPNYYHAAYFSLLSGRFTELNRLSERCAICFTDEVPPMWVFTPAKLTQVLSAAGMIDIRVRGFPVTIYPTVEDATISGSSELAQMLLADGTAGLNGLLEMEEMLCSQAEAAARGNNLLAVGTAPPRGAPGADAGRSRSKASGG